MAKLLDEKYDAVPIELILKLLKNGGTFTQLKKSLPKPIKVKCSVKTKPQQKAKSNETNKTGTAVEKKPKKSMKKRDIKVMVKMLDHK